MNGWIPVEERLPEDCEEIVLVQVSGKPADNILFDNAFEFALYEKEEGWMLDNYPEREVVMQGTHYEQIYESRVGADTLSNTNEPSAAALIRAQGQQLRKETVLEYWRRTRGNNNAEMGRNRTEKRIPQGIHKSKE